MTLKKRVVLFTVSNYESGASGDAVNDRKLMESIPSNYKKILINPKYSEGNKLKLFSILKFFINNVKMNFTSKNIFITHGSKLAIIPILLRKIFKNKIIVRLGCTPLMFVERAAFLKNPDFKPKTKSLLNILIFLESFIEKYALRHADKFIVENYKSKKIIEFYGADPNKIKEIPYYVQNYFLSGKNPKFNCETDFFKIGYTGRFKKYDLLEPVIDSISQLRDCGYKIKLYLIGDGPNRKYIENYVKIKNLTKNVIFKGPKSHREVSNLIDNYRVESKKFFKEYKPDEDDNLALIELLIDPQVYETLKLLRQAIVTRNDLEKLKKKGVDDVDYVLKKLWQGRMIQVFQDERGNEYYALLSDFYIEKFFPKYLLNVIRSEYAKKSKSNQVLIEYLNVLHDAFQAKPKKKSKVKESKPKKEIKVKE